ncbi:hypothetical protein U3516DRAFT_673447 [Neocallimastix sp. 'constans']
MSSIVIKTNYSLFREPNYNDKIHILQANNINLETLFTKYKIKEYQYKGPDTNVTYLNRVNKNGVGKYIFEQNDVNNKGVDVLEHLINIIKITGNDVNRHLADINNWKDLYIIKLMFTVGSGIYEHIFVVNIPDIEFILLNKVVLKTNGYKICQRSRIVHIRKTQNNSGSHNNSNALQLLLLQVLIDINIIEFDTILDGRISHLSLIVIFIPKNIEIFV